MKNKEFNEDKFLFELFNSTEIEKVWVRNGLCKDHVSSVQQKINVFKDKYYENDEINSGFVNSIKRFLKRDIGKEHIFPMLGAGFICGVMSGAAVAIATAPVGIPIALTFSSLVINGAIGAALILPISSLVNRSIEKINQIFSKKHNYMQTIKNFAENKLKNELKDYSIDELKNISYLKQFKLNEINNLKELNKKINEINKDLQDGFKNEYGESKNYFLIKNTISVLKEKLNNTTLQEISNLNQFNKISTNKQILNSQLLNSNNNDKSISQIQEKLHQNNKLKELNKKATISQNTPTPF